MADAAKKIDAAEIPEPEKDKLFESGGPSFEGVFGEMKKTVEEDRQTAENLEHDITGTAPALEARYGTTVNPTEAAGLQALGKEVEDAEAELEVVVSEMEGLSMREQEEQDFQMGRLLHDIDTEKARPAEAVGAPAPEAPETPEVDYSAMSDAELSSLYEKLFDESVADAKAHPEKLKPYKKALKTGIMPDDPEADNAEINKVFAEIRARRGGKKQTQSEAVSAPEQKPILLTQEMRKRPAETVAADVGALLASLEKSQGPADVNREQINKERSEAIDAVIAKGSQAYRDSLNRDRDQLLKSPAMLGGIRKFIEARSAEDIVRDTVNTGNVSQEEADSIIESGRAEEIKALALKAVQEMQGPTQQTAEKPAAPAPSTLEFPPLPDVEQGPLTPLELKMPPVEAMKLPPLSEIEPAPPTPLVLEMPPGETAAVKSSAEPAPKPAAEPYVDVDKILADSLLEAAKELPDRPKKPKEKGPNRKEVTAVLSEYFEKEPDRMPDDVRSRMTSLSPADSEAYLADLQRMYNTMGDSATQEVALKNRVGLSDEQMQAMTSYDFKKSEGLLKNLYAEAIRVAEAEIARRTAPTISAVEKFANKFNRPVSNKKTVEDTPIHKPEPKADGGAVELSEEITKKLGEAVRNEQQKLSEIGKENGKLAVSKEMKRLRSLESAKLVKELGIEAEGPLAAAVKGKFLEQLAAARK